MILAGDIGGTKAMLLLASVRQGRLEPVFEPRYAVAAYPAFNRRRLTIVNPRPAPAAILNLCR